MPDDPPRTNEAPLGQPDTVVPTWARRTIYTGAGAFGALNLTLSSLSIGHLAYEHLQLGMLRSTALGLTPDAGALVAGTLWVACTGHLRTWGRNASLGLVAGSVVGNAADILATAGHVTPLLVPLAVLMAVAAPILALLMGHLVLLVKAASSSARDRSTIASSPPAAADPPSLEAAVVTGPPGAPPAQIGLRVIPAASVLTRSVSVNLEPDDGTEDEELGSEPTEEQIQARIQEWDCTRDVAIYGYRHGCTSRAGVYRHRQKMRKPAQA